MQTAGKLDKTREFGEVWGDIGARYTQDGKYYNGKGAEVFPFALKETVESEEDNIQVKKTRKRRSKT